MRSASCRGEIPTISNQGGTMLAAIAAAVVVSAAGWPRPESQVDYDMAVRLLPDSVLARGSTQITFVPAYPADTLWLHLYPNAYRDPSTSFGTDEAEWGDYTFATAKDDDYGWIALSDWTLNGRPVQVRVDETLGFIPLDSTAQPGDTIRLAGTFDVKVPAFWSRMGHDGDHYEMSQWYPKMCVLDDRGWHTSRYHSEGEFFGDYGSYDVTLSVPDSFVTVATGRADSTWLSADSLVRSERWHASPVHDFAWAADPSFVLMEHDFAYGDSLGGNRVRVHVAARRSDADDWEKTAAWADSTLSCYGEWYGEYPYPDLWIVESSSGGGMEYPQLVMIGRFDPPAYRYFEMVVAHEIGHQWFYGMIGNDEVDEAWLDEGINTFSEIRYFEREYGVRGNMTSLPGWVSDASDVDGSSASYVGMVARGEEVPVLSTSTAASGGRYDYGGLYYSKPALFMRMLQNQMGGDAFDRFMRTYLQRFSFHHPRTEDVQAIAEEVTGRSWQAEFDTWLRTTATSDVRVEGISWSGGSTLVTVSGDVPVPVVLDLGLYGPGASVLERVPLTAGSPSVAVARIPGHWWRAEVDPETRYLDCEPWNNSFPEDGSLRPYLYPFDQPSRFNTWLLPVPGWADGTWEAGVYGMTQASGPWNGGPLQVSGYWRQPLEGGRPGSWALNLARTGPMSRSGSSSVSVDMTMAYGREDLSLSCSRTATGLHPSDPTWALRGTVGFSGVSDNTILGADRYDEGYGPVFSAGASRWNRSILGSRASWLRIQGSPDWDGRRWLSSGLGESLSFSRLPMSPSIDLFAGRTWGDAPLQYLFHPGGGLGAGDWLLPPDGDLSAGEHYYDEEGPSMPGYGKSRASGRVGLRLGGTLQVPRLPLSVFGDAGWVVDSEREITSGNTMSDAGLGLDLMLVKAWFPVWVSRPMPGDDEVEFRWRVSFRPQGLMMLFL